MHSLRKELVRKSLADREDIIFEKDLPWMHCTDNYALALTGNAF